MTGTLLSSRFSVTLWLHRLGTSKCKTCETSSLLSERVSASWWQQRHNQVRAQLLPGLCAQVLPCVEYKVSWLLVREACDQVLVEEKVGMGLWEEKSAQDVASGW